MKYNLEAICKHNVDRSRNQLVENLKSTLCTLASMNCSNTSVRVQIDLEDSGLHFAMTFQTRDCLKQFQTIHCSFFVETLKAVGQCCPLLKLLKLNKQFSGGMVCDNEALAIAETMPKLHHLQILCNDLTNTGLQTVLDGCLDLESLDLCQCFNLDLLAG